MALLPWLDKFDGQSTSELIALEGKYRIDSLVCAFEEAMDQKAARVGLDILTTVERVILAVEAMEREVNNGGHAQFFVNTSRDFVPFIGDALQHIGCPKTAEIMQRAIAIAEQHPFSKMEIKNGTWDDNEERSDALSDCDNEYFERPENIEESLFAFIKANRAKINP
jgi:hypothetical protein